MTNYTVYHLGSISQCKGINPHTYSKRNEPQNTQPDQDTNGTLHQNVYHNHHNDCALIDNNTNDDTCHRDLYFDVISLQGNETRIAYNNFPFHDSELEADDPTDNDQDDDQDDDNDQLVCNDDDMLEDDNGCQLQQITAHHRVPPDDPQYRHSTYTVRILWDTGELTDEPLSTFGKDASIECVMLLPWTVIDD